MAPLLLLRDHDLRDRCRDVAGYDGTGGGEYVANLSRLRIVRTLPDQAAIQGNSPADRQERVFLAGFQTERAWRQFIARSHDDRLLDDAELPKYQHSQRHRSECAVKIDGMRPNVGDRARQ